MKCQYDELCRFVVNNQMQLESVLSTKSEMLDRLQHGSNISVYFLEDVDSRNAICQSAQSGGCLIGMGWSIPNAYTMKQKSILGKKEICLKEVEP
jgi:hypothetical protein